LFIEFITNLYSANGPDKFTTLLKKGDINSTLNIFKVQTLFNIGKQSGKYGFSIGKPIFLIVPLF
jgi:hypothetical protein